LQYFAKKEKAPAGASQDNRRQSISAKAGFRQKEVRNPLQFALYVYFTIWMIYPLLWVLAAEGLITSVVNHCVTVMMDVLAKSMYGFALLEFQLRIDKSQVEFTQLKVTKAELQEEIMEEKKKIRKITKKQEEEEMSRRGDDYEDEDRWPAHLQSTRFAQGFTSPASSTRPSPKPSPKPSPPHNFASLQQNSAFAVGQLPAMESYGNGNMMRSKPPMMGDGRSMNSANGNVNMMPVRSNPGSDSPRRPSPMNDGGMFSLSLALAIPLSSVLYSHDLPSESPLDQQSLPHTSLDQQSLPHTSLDQQSLPHTSLDQQSLPHTSFLQAQRAGVTFRGRKRGFKMFKTGGCKLMRVGGMYTRACSECQMAAEWHKLCRWLER
jgi:hypothetical protein